MRGLRVVTELAKPSVRTLMLNAVVVTALVAAALAPIAPRPSVNGSGLFELGPAKAANIRGDGDPGTGPDWATAFGGGDGVFDGDGNPILPLPPFGIAASFVMDDLSQKGLLDRTTFSGAGGSNKNNDLITAWHWDAGNVPPKDDLSNAYAYAAIQYVDGEAHLILYTGFERLDPSGDSHVDIEFFQDDVSLDEPIPCNDPGPDATPCDFVGVRTVGDIIVSMDFLNGGGFGTMSIREWMGPLLGYVDIGSLSGEGCNVADTICGFNNGGNIEGGPWPNYNNHGDEITFLQKNAFTEFGVDVTALEGETPCISTMMGKTRSSQSFTAELKDFAGPVGFNICGAAIQIAPDGVNEVGDEHTFTVSVSRVLVDVEAPAPDGTIVDVDLASSNGAAAQIISDTCASPGTITGKCYVTFTSDTAGTIVGTASADVDIFGQTFHVETDGDGRNSGPATKVYVDARISIDPDDLNSVFEGHTFTVTVTQNAGDGAGYVAATEGDVDASLLPSGGAVPLVDGASSTCDDAGDNLDGNGQCTIVFTSMTAGSIDGHASVSLSILGLSVSRQTDGANGNSDDATKVFVSGSLAWRKVDNAAQLQGGATFQMCRTHDWNSATGTFDDVADLCEDILDNAGLDEDADEGEFLLTGLRLGRYTVREIDAPDGFVEDPDTASADLSLDGPDATVAEPFVNNRPIVKLTGFGYTNTPKGTPTSGVVSGITVYTIKLKNYGNVSALLDLTLDVDVSDVGGGSALCSGTGVVGCTLTALDVVVAAGAEVTFSLTLDYTDLPDGAVVTASLVATYTTPDGFVRSASGSPAWIIFTIQGD